MTLVGVCAVVCLILMRGSEGVQDCQAGIVVYCNELCAPELRAPNVRHLIFEGVIASFGCVPSSVEVSAKIQQIDRASVVIQKCRCHLTR